VSRDHKGRPDQILLPEPQSGPKTTEEGIDEALEVLGPRQLSEIRTLLGQFATQDPTRCSTRVGADMWGISSRS
jgi:hypothetical protein